jgi:DNA-3-methyladenine glycosylase
MPDVRMTDRRWFSRHPVEVAWDLIGCILRVSRDGVVVAGRIVEVEAYAGPSDPASHAGRLKVARAAMSGPPGTVYTYLSYGIHTMMNIVSHEIGASGGILLRALQPLEGQDHMHARRNGVAEAQLARGPGSLGQAMGIQLADIGTDLMISDTMAVFQGEAKHAIHAGPRIGISKAVLAPWRFFEYPSPYVSGHRRGRPVSRNQVADLIPPPGTPIE